MKIILDFVTNSSEADYYDPGEFDDCMDCQDCRDCDDCRDCEDCRDCDDCGDCRDCIDYDCTLDPEEYPDYWWEDLDD